MTKWQEKFEDRKGSICWHYKLQVKVCGKLVGKPTRMQKKGKEIGWWEKKKENEAFRMKRNKDAIKKLKIILEGGEECKKLG